MFGNLDVFKMAHAMAVHAGQKQAVSAQNVANSDTPEYKALSVVDFSDTYRTNGADNSFFNQKSSRSNHLHGAMAGQLPDPIVDSDSVGSPNGNSVSIETEMLKSLDAKRQHDRALAIYKSSLGIIRATLSRS